MSINNIPINQIDNQKNKYEILKEDTPNYDFSFKILIVGNPGKINFI